MTIGDLEALLQLKNIDPVKVALLLKDIQDLAKALVRLKPLMFTLLTWFNCENAKYQLQKLHNDIIMLC